MQSIVDDLNASLSNSSYLPACTIDYRAVKTAVALLEPGKKEGNTGFTSNYIIRAGEAILNHISCLFVSIIVHGTATGSFLLSTIVPKLKGHNANLSGSLNFCAIALNSVHGKFLDNIIYHAISSSVLKLAAQRFWVLLF